MEAIFGIPYDVLVAAGVLCVFLLFNYTVGKNHSAAMLMAMYAAGAIVALAPVTAAIPFAPVFVFAAVTLVAYGIMVRCGFFDAYIVPAGWELGLFAALQASVAIAVVVGLEPGIVGQPFSPNFARVFLDPVVRSIMLAAPLCVFLVVRGRQ